MKQLTIFDDQGVTMRQVMPDAARQMDAARRRRDTILIQQDSSNGPEFGRRMREFIVSHLRANGPTSGEDITNAAKSAGIIPSKGDDRAYGGSYMSLSKRGVIVKAGHCQRRKGHATNGGIVWAMANE